MKFWQAMREFENGRSVRCKEWLPGHFMNRDPQKDNSSYRDKMDFWFFKHEEWEYSPVEKRAPLRVQESDTENNHEIIQAIIDDKRFGCAPIQNSYLELAKELNYECPNFQDP